MGLEEISRTVFVQSKLAIQTQWHLSQEIWIIVQKHVTAALPHNLQGRVVSNPVQVVVVSQKRGKETAASSVKPSVSNVSSAWIGWRLALQGEIEHVYPSKSSLFDSPMRLDSSSFKTMIN